jgi:hypothetical protein
VGEGAHPSNAPASWLGLLPGLLRRFKHERRFCVRQSHNF